MTVISGFIPALGNCSDGKMRDLGFGVEGLYLPSGTVATVK